MAAGSWGAEEAPLEEEGSSPLHQDARRLGLCAASGRCSQKPRCARLPPRLATPSGAFTPSIDLKLDEGEIGCWTSAASAATRPGMLSGPSNPPTPSAPSGASASSASSGLMPHVASLDPLPAWRGASRRSGSARAFRPGGRPGGKLVAGLHSGGGSPPPGRSSGSIAYRLGATAVFGVDIPEVLAEDELGPAAQELGCWAGIDLCAQRSRGGPQLPGGARSRWLAERDGLQNAGGGSRRLGPAGNPLVPSGPLA